MKVDTNVTPTKDEEQTGQLLLSKNGNISAVAKCLKVARKTVYARINQSEYLQEALADAREKRLDDAEDQLGKAVSKGEAWAVCFTLKTQGKSRGYIEKQEHEHSGPGGGPIQSRFVVEIIGSDSTSNSTTTDQGQDQ